MQKRISKSSDTGKKQIITAMFFGVGTFASLMISIGSWTGKICGFKSGPCESISQSEYQAIVFFAIGSILLFIAMYLRPKNREIA